MKTTLRLLVSRWFCFDCLLSQRGSKRTTPTQGGIRVQPAQGTDSQHSPTAPCARPYIYCCIYMYKHVYIYICVSATCSLHTSTFLFLHIYTYMFMYIIHLHTYAHVHIYMYTYLHICTYIHICFYIYTYTYVHIYIYVCVYAYIPVYIYIYIYTFLVKQLSPTACHLIHPQPPASSHKMLELSEHTIIIIIIDVSLRLFQPPSFLFKQPTA